MEQNNWKVMQISTILGLPNLDSRYFPPHVIVALKERFSEVTDIGAVILFGSIVRGDATSKSDIDIMIVPMEDADIQMLNKEVSRILRSVETAHGLQINFSPIIYKGDEDSYFLWEVVKDGSVLFVRPEMVVSPIANMSPHALISYSFSGLNDQTKKKIQRFLFESKHGANIDKKNKMVYIAPGVILIALEKSKEIILLFESNNVNYTLVKLWK